MNAKRTHVVIPEQLVKEIDALVGTRQRSKFLTEAAQRELMRIRQLTALEQSSGTWKDSRHPEIKAGSAKWVKKLRQESEARFARVIQE